MAKFQATKVLRIVIVLTALISVALVLPLVVGWWSERVAMNGFVLADSQTQERIVQSYLRNLESEPPLCSPSGECIRYKTYFDKMSAQLLPVETEKLPDQFVALTMGEATLVDRANPQIPIPLQELLQRSVVLQTHNVDPRVPGITYVSAPQERPPLGTQEACSASPTARLVRISRAAVHIATNQAVSLVLVFYCGGNPGISVVRFVRQNTDWRVAERQANGA